LVIHGIACALAAKTNLKSLIKGGLSRNRRNFRPPIQTSLIALMAEGRYQLDFIEIMLDMSENAETGPNLAHFHSSA